MFEVYNFKVSLEYGYDVFFVDFNFHTGLKKKNRQTCLGDFCLK